MTDKEIIRAAMKLSGYTQTSLAEKLGYAHQSGVGNKLCNRGGMNTQNFVEFLEAMDFEVIVRPRFDKRKTMTLTTPDDKAVPGTDRGASK